MPDTQTKLTQVLDQIKSASAARTPTELDNVLSDLTFVADYLEKGLYSESDIVGRQGDNVGRRTAEFMRYLEGFYNSSQVWFDVLATIPLDTHTKVVDVLPGWAPKVEIALARHDFKGSVSLVDLNVEALTQLQKVLTFFRPTFSTQTVVEDIFSLSIPSHYDLLTANHIVDDLLLNAAAQKRSVSINSAYQHAELFTDLTEAAKHDASSLISTFANTCAGLMNSTGTMVFVQYRSVFETSKSLDTWFTFCNDQYQLLMQELEKVGWIATHHTEGKYDVWVVRQV